MIVLLYYLINTIMRNERNVKGKKEHSEILKRFQGKKREKPGGVWRRLLPGKKKFYQNFLFHLSKNAE